MYVCVLSVNVFVWLMCVCVCVVNVNACVECECVCVVSVNVCVCGECECVCAENDTGAPSSVFLHALSSGGHGPPGECKQHSPSLTEQLQVCCPHRTLC